MTVQGTPVEPEEPEEGVQPVEPVDSWSEVDPDWVDWADPEPGDLDDSEELSEEELQPVEPDPEDTPLEGPRWVRYELWAQNLSEGTESYLAASADFDGPLEVEVGGLTPGVNMRFWVRLIDNNGNHSNMSEPVDMRLPLDLTPPVAPVAPTVQEVLGMVSIHHTTELQGEKPDDFSHINIYGQAMHPPGNPDGEPGGLRLLARFYEESSTVVGDFYHDVKHRVFATAVDTTGNESAWSPSVEVTPRLPFDDAELQEALRRLNEEVLPGLAEDQARLDEAMEYLNQLDLPGLEARLQSGLDEVNQNLIPLQQLVDQNQARLDTLNNTTLPGLQAKLDDGLAEVNRNLVPLEQLTEQNKSRLDTLHNTTLPGIERNLAAVESDLSTAKGQLNTAQAQLNTLNNSTIPGITSDLETAQGLISTIDSTALRDQTGVIKANHMSANSVVANAILANAVTTAKIATGAVTANEIAALTITANELATNSVTAGKILANAVTTAKIAANAVTANEIAANTITAGNIASNAIQTRHITAGSVNTNELAADAVNASKIAANAVTTAKIATNAVTANEIAANTIVAGNIATNAVQTRHLQANSVGADQVIANSIGTNHLQARSVQAHQLQVGSFDNLFNDQQFTSYRDFSTSTNSPWVRVSGNPQDVWRWENDSNVGASIVNVVSGAASRMELYCGEVAPGDQMSFRIRVRKSSGADGFRILARHRGENRSSPMSTTTLLGNSFSGLTSDSIYEVNWTVPSNSGIRELWIDFETLSTSTGAARFSEPYMRRRIESQLLVEGSVLTDKLAANAVNADKIATNAIQARHISAGSVSTNELAANAVNADKIAANAITTAKIAANAVGANEIAANAITASQIRAGAIDGMSITGASIQTSASIFGSSPGGVRITETSNGGEIEATHRGSRVFRAGHQGIYSNGLQIDGNATLTGSLRVGSGGTGEGGLVPDEGRVRLLGRNPWGVAGSEDMYSYGGSAEFSVTHKVSSELERWSVTYDSTAPYGNRSPILGADNASNLHQTMLTYHTVLMRPDLFEVRIRSQAQSGTTIRFRMRYLAVWR